MLNETWKVNLTNLYTFRPIVVHDLFIPICRSSIENERFYRLTSFLAKSSLESLQSCNIIGDGETKREREREWGKRNEEEGGAAAEKAWGMKKGE